MGSKSYPHHNPPQGGGFELPLFVKLSLIEVDLIRLILPGYGLWD
jgi:hypothetical protein